MSAGMGISGGKKTYDGATDLLSQSILAVEEMQSLNTNVAKKGFKVVAQNSDASPAPQSCISRVLGIVSLIGTISCPPTNNSDISLHQS